MFILTVNINVLSVLTTVHILSARVCYLEKPAVMKSKQQFFYALYRVSADFFPPCGYVAYAHNLNEEAIVLNPALLILMQDFDHCDVLLYLCDEYVMNI